MHSGKISAIITTFNEAEHIDAAIESVSWADEILVMDSYSTDGTPQLAKRHAKVRFLQHEYISPAKQKNRAIALARFPWVFILDADERVPAELAAEVKAIVRQEGGQKDGYWIPRSNIVFGKRLRYLWRHDKVIRLIKREVCRYRDVQVHEEIETKGVKIGHLKAALLHYTIKDMEHYLDKIRRYAHWQAQMLYDAGESSSYWKLVLKPLVRFLKHYLKEGAILDGKAGLVLSGIMAWGVWLRYVFLMELEEGEQ